MKEKKDKKPKYSEKTRKPVNHLDFNALDLAIVDGVLCQDKLLVLNRAWRTTTDDRFTLCTVLRVDGSSVTLSDETLGQEFSFDLVKDTGIYQLLRIYDKTKIRKVSKLEKIQNTVLKRFKPGVSLVVGELVEELSVGSSMSDVRTALIYLAEQGKIRFDEAGNVSLYGDVVLDQEITDNITVDEEREEGTLSDDEDSNSD